MYNKILQEIENNIIESTNSFGSIKIKRREQLARVSEYIKVKVLHNEEVNLVFICTHNSRRSHISQIWAQAASYFYDIPNIYCHSAGTEITAFNPRAVKTMQNEGFIVNKKDNSDNPVYEVLISEHHPSIKAFSKTMDDKSLPDKNYIAIMTCDNADKACPVVPGADIRFPVKYADPKIGDNTPEEEKIYSERSNQIRTEMVYLFSLIK